jgi:hypothetical protein
MLFAKASEVNAALDDAALDDVVPAAATFEFGIGRIGLPAFRLIRQVGTSQDAGLYAAYRL